MSEASPSEGDARLVSRRRLLTWVSVGLGAAAAAVVSVPIVAYLLSPLLNMHQTWISLGPISQFTLGATQETAFDDPSPLPWAGQTARTAAWVRRTSETEFIVFAVNCTHLGCPVSWVPGGNLFMCPCHGGVYYADGTVAGGPPPHPLFRYQTRVQNGNLEILSRPLPIA